MPACMRDREFSLVWSRSVINSHDALGTPRRFTPDAEPSGVSHHGSRKIRLVRIDDDRYQGSGSLLPQRDRLEREGLRHAGHVLHALERGGGPHRRIDGSAQGGPRCRRPAGVDGLCRGRRCRCERREGEEGRRHHSPRRRRYSRGRPVRRHRRSGRCGALPVQGNVRTANAAAGAGHAREPSAGANSMPPTWARQSPSMRSCSDGPRPSTTTWGRWASTRCSPPAARPSAA